MTYRRAAACASTGEGRAGVDLRPSGCSPVFFHRQIACASIACMSATSAQREAALNLLILAFQLGV